MINSRAIEDLHPKVQPLCRAFIANCALAGIDAIITSTYRDNEAQDALYAQGRTKIGKVVTNARGGDSFHNYRVAFDFVPVVGGKARWDSSGFLKCGEIAESLGLEWAGRWDGKFREMAHCQFRSGLTISDFKAGKTLG